MTFLIFIMIGVFYLLLIIIYQFTYRTNLSNYGYSGDNVTHNTLLENIWTTVPTVILCLIILPSMTLLYSLDESFDPIFTLKVIVRQLYWSYEFTTHMEDLENTLFYNSAMLKSYTLNFDSYMDLDLEQRSFFRLLKRDNTVILPVGTDLRIIVTSTYVIHSWAIPALVIKVYACPGLLNQISRYISRVVQFFVQFIELFGLNHAFMPISIQASPIEVFLHSQLNHVL